MSGVPKKTQVYSLALALLTAGALAAAAVWYGDSVPWTARTAFTVVILLAMNVAVDHYEISFPQTVVSVEVSVNAVLHLASGILLGVPLGAIIAMVGELASDLLARRQAIKIIVNVANFGLATLGATIVYQLLDQPGFSPLHSLQNMFAILVAAMTYSLINSWCLAIVVSPVVGLTPITMWKANFNGFYMEVLTLPTLGGVLVVLAQDNPLGLLLIAVPLAGPHVALQALRRNQDQTRATIERLADALERRDAYTHQHSVRVTEYVTAILDQMPHVPVEAAQTITAASRIHDLGKVGTRDVALNKPGALTQEERNEMQAHAAIGAEIISGLDVYKQSAAIVRHHHERWDGSGYPDGLRGDEIPLGARIIAVADAFDAMTSDRVYRRAMTVPAALAELRRGSGSQFDPHVVDAFVVALTGHAGAVPEPRLAAASVE